MQIVENTLLNNTKNIAGSFHRGLRLMGLALCLLASSFALGADPVGHVLLVNGAAERVDAGGSRQALADKAAVYEGDTLETAAGALLQIKMIDKALLVLQANSTLLIQTYRYNPEGADANAVRLDLVKGRARSVTGDLGESNHDAFRLNTPIAAIGIRGTDFETSTTGSLTRVRLNSGAIVISPLSDDCPATAFGPCISSNSLLLTEELESPVAELRATDAAPRLIELPEYDADDQGSLNEQKEEERIHAENQAERIVGAAEERRRPREFVPAPLPEGWVDQIHWGRWGEAPAGVEAPSSASLRQQGKETLFRNDLFVLFRDGFVSMGSGQASFALQSAQAGIVNGDSFTPVTIADGKLMINFNERAFDTGLTFGSDMVKGLSLNASGTIDSSGLFRSDGGNMGVLGALAEDNKQAGYLFSHSLNDTMSLQGATQWQSP
jgi:hypothetical protein